VKQVRISEVLKRYVVDIVNATRSTEGVQLGASPRASIALMKISQALALFDGNEFVTPEHIQELLSFCPHPQPPLPILGEGSPNRHQSDSYII
jgi:MoxR-like ATPase